MKSIILSLILIIATSATAQEQYFTKSGHIDFYSHAPLEDIQADNNQVAAFLEVPSGKLTFAALMKSFEFEKALMQEHFNENYVESDEYPKAIFKGIITDFEKVDLSQKGEIEVSVVGKLTLHGVTKALSTKATLNIQKDKIVGKSVFIAKPEDFKIKIPNAVKNNIAKEIRVTVNVDFLPYKK